MLYNEQIDKAELSSEERNELPDTAFALVKVVNGKKVRKLPYKKKDGTLDRTHIQNALARINQVKGFTKEEIEEARRKLISAAKKIGMNVQDDIEKAVKDFWYCLKFYDDNSEKYKEFKENFIELAKKHDIYLMNDIKVDILKAEIDEDIEDGVIYGVASLAEIEDSEGDIISIKDLKKGAHFFISESRVGDIDHNYNQQGEVVESLVLDDDMHKAIISGKIKKNSWIIGWKPFDINIAKSAKKGEYVGFSIGGFATRGE